MAMLMTIHPAQGIEEVNPQGVTKEFLLEQDLIGTEPAPEIEANAQEFPLETEVNPARKTAEKFEPEFDGDLKSVSWAHLKLFKNSEDL